ncbi:hypothetical protein GCM10007886_28300 [Methylobacterium gregans]|nr:hypothetical protein GCM10007886_28300 [Methylobacterium gregans]
MGEGAKRVTTGDDIDLGMQVRRAGSFRERAGSRTNGNGAAGPVGRGGSGCSMAPPMR